MPYESSLFDGTPQWVCLECGYNMIGEMPDVCPFCGARHDRFLPWDEAEKTYRVASQPVNGYVDQLLSTPKLGLEHAAYRIETGQGAVWIDSPSAFNRELDPARAILFTHHHFMGASNQYKRLWNAEVRLHDRDAQHPLSSSFDIDLRFTGDYVAYGIEAFHTGGHTPGFTFYIFRDVLFICDYVFLTDTGMRFNPFGPKQDTRKRAGRIHEIVEGRALETVCGYDYVISFAEWLMKFKRLISKP